MSTGYTVQLSNHELVYGSCFMRHAVFYKDKIPAGMTSLHCTYSVHIPGHKSSIFPACVCSRNC